MDGWMMALIDRQTDEEMGGQMDGWTIQVSFTSVSETVKQRLKGTRERVCDMYLCVCDIDQYTRSKKPLSRKVLRGKTKRKRAKSCVCVCIGVQIVGHPRIFWSVTVIYIYIPRQGSLRLYPSLVGYQIERCISFFLIWRSFHA